MENKPWWQAVTCYQIYLPSFCDGNGDGLGDFPGLIARLDYLQDLGIGAVWITPFYPSPLVDNGYDISDYCAVDRRFGDLDDFRKVVAGCHQRGIRVIIDLVINHVSSEHPWFKDAWNNPASQYRDYFIFRHTPNNWQSFFPEVPGQKSRTPGSTIITNLLRSRLTLTGLIHRSKRKYIGLSISGWRKASMASVLT